MKIAIVSTLTGAAWGGSEELWATMAETALTQGHEVILSLERQSATAPKVLQLQQRGAQVLLRSPARRGKVGYVLSQLDFSFNEVFRLKPDIICFNQGGTFDPFMMNLGNLLKLMEQSTIPYVILCQRNEDTFIPTASQRQAAISLFEKASGIMFVSAHNLRIAERQIAKALPHAQVVRNPVNLTSLDVVPWNHSEPVCFANVGRLECSYKGQDVLLEALSAPEWQARNWRLNLYGSGPDQDYLRDLAQLYGIDDRVQFHGHVSDIRALWAENHVLVLPSRREGTPLVLVEAMLCGRPAVVTDVGGNVEWITEAKTGFIAPAPTTTCVGQALESAWQAQNHWQAMGEAAHDVAMTQFDREPGKSLLEILQKAASSNYQRSTA